MIGQVTSVFKTQLMVLMFFHIPFDEANTDYQEYLEWVSEGNTAEAADEDILTWDVIRATRDQILRDTDWTMTSGATVDQAQWAAYRQNYKRSSSNL